MAESENERSGGNPPARSSGETGEELSLGPRTAMLGVERADEIVVGAISLDDEDEDDDVFVTEDPIDQKLLNEMSCGWCGITVDCFKLCSNIKGYLLALSLTGLFHYLVPFGLLFSVLTTLEKRFHFSSTESGSIASAYQFSAMFFTVFVGYIGEKGHKPVWVGVGTLALAVGSVLFSLPHFLAEPYHVTPFNQSQEDSLVCPDVNSTSMLQEKCDMAEGADEQAVSFIGLFIFSSVILGFAGAPVFTLGVTYLDENLQPKDFGLFLGIYNAFLNIGPALGFFVGALTLSLYTDIHVLKDEDSLSLTPGNPLWVGAWWLGFLAAASIVIVLALIIMGFPKRQPGSEKLREKHPTEAQKGSEFESQAGFCKKVLDFPRALLKIVTNPPFMSICFAMATEWFIIAGVAVFAPKFFEAQLNISSSDVASILGVLSITAQLIGALSSGIIINRLDLKFRGLIKLCLLCVVISMLASLAFTMHCPVVPFAGVTSSHERSRADTGAESAFSLPCNTHCDCHSKSFEPVCGSDDIMYYSPCHAGCNRKDTFEEEVIFRNCECITESTRFTASSSRSYNISGGVANSTSLTSVQPPDPLEEGYAVPERCRTTCLYKWPYFILLWVFFFINTFNAVPAWAGSIRCVSHSQRAFALGVQTVIYGLGSAPSPIVFGLLIDKSCLVWEALCDGSQICWLYDNRTLAYTLLGLCLCAKLLTLIFFSCAHLFYKPILDCEEGEGRVEQGGEE